MDRYDPEFGPVAGEWLAIDDDERVRLIEEVHRDARIPLPKSARYMHATLHSIVENQLAPEDQTTVRAALMRLMKDGLTRHEAVHAIGSVLAENIYDILNRESSEPAPHASYCAALDRLTAETWRAG